MKPNNNLIHPLLQFGTMAFFILIALFSCTKSVKHQSLDEMIRSAKSNANAITVVDYKNMVDHNEDHIIIDCRQAEDFLISHIPNAINIPRGILEFSGKISDRNAKIIIYNYDSDCSSLCAVTLKKLKYKNVLYLENGWKGWSKKYPRLFEQGKEKEVKKASPKTSSGGGCGG